MKRPHIPLAVKLEAALRQLGLDPATAELDHDPALELRAIINYDNDRCPVYHPAANDPRYLVWRSNVEHATKTNGPGGEKRITTRGGDHGDAAHLRRLTKKEAAFRGRLLAKTEAPEGFTAIKPTTFKRKISSRSFEKRRK